MIMRPGQYGRLAAAALVATLFGCGGGESVETTASTSLSGRINLPAFANCTGCNNSIVDFGVIGLVKDGSPIQVVALKTDSQGNFDTGNLNPKLFSSSGLTLDTNGDGKRTLIVAATVKPATLIGGVQSLATGTQTTKDFNATTQVACNASVLLTKGITSPCLIKTTCGPTDQGCLQTVDPDALDDARIARLEQAAAFISASAVFPMDNNCASCAIITCTNAGTATATSQCVSSAFTPCASQ